MRTSHYQIQERGWALNDKHTQQAYQTMLMTALMDHAAGDELKCKELLLATTALQVKILDIVGILNEAAPSLLPFVHYVERLEDDE